MAERNEAAEKRNRVRGYLRSKALGGVALTLQRNFAWYTCGGDNHVLTTSELGAATLVLTPERQCVVTTNIEAGRMADEEVGDDFEVLDYPWHEEHRRVDVVKSVLAGKPGATDAPLGDLPPLPPDFADMRFSLTPAEIERYRVLGRECSAAMGEICRGMAPGMRETDVAAGLSARLLKENIVPTVVLVAADERVYNYRHPIVTDKVIREHVMVVLCGRRGGLVAALTRMVHFGRLPAELARKHETVCAIDAALILGTRAGQPVGEVFRGGVRAYAEHGFADEWRRHHQGGPIGYAEREYIATPGETRRVQINQAFAWNPSIEGTKSEDTIIITRTGPEVITAPEDWPLIEARAGEDTVARAAILEK